MKKSFMAVWNEMNLMKSLAWHKNHMQQSSPFLLKESSKFCYEKTAAGTNFRSFSHLGVGVARMCDYTYGVVLLCIVGNTYLFPVTKGNNLDGEE